MDQERSTIQEDLRGLLQGEVRCDDVAAQLFASDASLHQIRPLGVVFPKNSDDVSACVKYAAEKQISIHARGAGTGLAGESLGPGLVIDFSRFMRRIVTVGSDTVTVQPGVVHERLNHALRNTGRHFGPDPAMSHATTLGGVVGVDSGGSRYLRYGSARGNVRQLKVVLANGEQMEVGKDRLSRWQTEDVSPRQKEIVQQLAALLTANSKTLSLGPKAPSNRAGYCLAGVLENDLLDLPRLLTGSEGTLALFTEITLATHPIPRCRGVALLFFDRLDTAARAVREIVRFSPSACDLIDRRHLALAREARADVGQVIPPDIEALLFVEFDGNDAAAVQDPMNNMLQRVCKRRRLAIGSRQATNEHDVERFWQLARRVVPTLFRMEGSTRAIPYVEDMAVPPESLADFLAETQNVLKRHQVTASLFAHAGHGQLHLRPFLDPANSAHLKLLPALANDLYEAAWRFGGTISGEHGTGLSRGAFVRKQSGPLFELFRQVKQIFDPFNVLNPGKVVDPPESSGVSHPRPVIGDFPLAIQETTPQVNGSAESPKTVVELQLRWAPGELSALATSCNGCGGCRDQSANGRMCPMFRMAPREDASPRSKANVLRGLLSGELPAEVLKSDLLQEVADLCFDCKMCRLECPAQVDIPRLMIEARAALVANKGLQPGDWLFTRLDNLLPWASRFSWLVNPGLRNLQARWILERLFGLAKGRKLPTFARKTFMQEAASRALTKPRRRTSAKVAYFVGSYANYNNPLLARAAVAVLEHNGISVFVPPNQRPSGKQLFSIGAIDRARVLAERNVRVLAEAVRQGYEIVATEPSAALCISQEYPLVLDDDDARLVAAHVHDLGAYLWQMHEQGQLKLDFRSTHLSLAYHQPCHLAALGVQSPGEELLRLIPGVSVRRTEKGCSGMAGTFGMRAKNFRSSLRVGWGLVTAVRRDDFQAGVTECTSCKIQMEQGTRKPTVHPVSVLAHAYQLMPELNGLFQTHSEDLVVS